MPVAHPTEWLTNLLEQDWSQTRDELEAEGHEFNQDVTPRFLEPRQEHVENVTGAQAVIQLYTAGSRDTVPSDFGRNYADKTMTLNVDSRAGTKGVADDTVDVVERIVANNRKAPHPDWDRILTWDTIHENSYSDYQHRVTAVTVDRQSRKLPTAKQDRSA